MGERGPKPGSHLYECPTCGKRFRSNGESPTCPNPKCKKRLSKKNITSPSAGHTWNRPDITGEGNGVRSKGKTKTKAKPKAKAPAKPKAKPKTKPVVAKPKAEKMEASKVEAPKVETPVEAPAEVTAPVEQKEPTQG